jgi:hypothetical protein
MQASATEIEAVANQALMDTASLNAELKQALAHNGPHALTTEQLESWRATAVRANKAIARLARLSWMADDRRNIEFTILLENVKRDALDREATFAHTWAKLRQHTQTAGGNGAPTSTVDRAHSSVLQIESALSALAPVPDTHFHGAPALALLQ